MSRAILAAKNGLKSHFPNPMVGCVIVHQNKVIAQGITSPYTGPHAEVNAINQVKDKSILSQCSLYVTLEPCAHYGNTPPCANLITSYSIPLVIIGVLDPNPKVAGKGIEILKKAGTKVITQVLEKECTVLHKRFLINQTHKRPYFILKWAHTTSGFIAPPIKNRNPYWISSLLAKQRSHQWRSEEHAILIGANTLLHDNPKLNTRLWKGEAPIPIYIDRDLSVPTDKSLFGIHKKIYCVVDHKHAPSNLKRKNIHYLPIDFNKELSKQIALTLFEQKISSVIVEGGTKTLALFLGAGLWDEIRLFETNGNINEGIKAPSFNAILNSEESLGNTLLKVYKKNHLKDAII